MTSMQALRLDAKALDAIWRRLVADAKTIATP
jgi:hypothetical protein